ncbi:MAG: AAA family ATPase, partial [Proteobacteria bacterium]|nr:AAA family ATPase [Pseudomonadota bacterium]
TDGFGEAGTVHAALFRLKNGRSLGWDKRTVLMVDEAAMLDTRVTGELLAEARNAGAKVILAGDDRQLASIERGGLFTELRQAHGSATLTEVTRQRVDWQRQAARDLAEGQFDAAVAAFDHHGAVTWRPDQDGSRTALVERWKADTAQDPKASRFVFAYTNEEVDRLNTALRQVRRERGELGSGDVTLATKHGPAAFAVGDRVQFTDTAKKLGIYNGTVGTLIGLDARTGEVAVRLDAPTGKAGRIVSWSAADGFEGFRHGYAGTIYKGQGKTLDHTYLLHTQHWRAAASYVALTRQRESAQLFVATETARDARQLAWQMARGEVRAASVAWATADELHPSQQSSPEEAGKAKATAASNTPVAPAPERNATGDDRRQAARREARQNKTGDTTAASRPRQVAGHGLSADQWLIAPRVSPDGRDSLGRGLDGGSVRAVVVADPGVQREREALMDYLRGGYRDPLAARARLDELVKREGFASAAARIANVPEQLGELRGTTGFFAGSAARQERVVALRVASAVPGSLSRIGEAERAAAERYRQGVQAQLAADATGIPRLSAQAEAAVNAVAAEKDDAGRLAAWKVVQGDASLRAELQAFRAAVEQRFRADGVRAMLRAEGRPGAVQLPGVREQAAVNRVSQFVGILRQGDRLAERQAATDRMTARQGQRPRLQP